MFQGSEENSEYTYKSEDGSVDLLAIARKLDPVTVQAMGREYKLPLEDRLAEEIDVGSAGVGL